jgi:TIGR03009 family protein
MLSSAARPTAGDGGRFSISIHRENCAMTFRRWLLFVWLVAGLCVASAAWAQEAGTSATPAPNAYPVSTSAAGAVAPTQQQTPPTPGQTPGQAAAAAAQAPTPPLGFPLSDVEQQFIAQTLQAWENTSSQVTAYSAEFEKLTYDGVWSGAGANQPMILSNGSVSFSKPDKGSFKEDKISRWLKKDPKDESPGAEKGWVPQPDEVGAHWVCDGTAVYEYNHRDKQLVVTTIPPQMRGQAISDGPLPFLFGAKASELMQRYWIRSKQSAPEDIWLEAYPKRTSDAQNYEHVDVLLDRKTMQPKAIQVHMPTGQQREVYQFKSAKINEKNLGTWFTGLFNSPRTPIGWTKVRQEDVAPAPQAARPQGVKR